MAPAEETPPDSPASDEPPATNEQQPTLTADGSDSIAEVALAIPVPDPAIGTERHELTIPLEDSGATVYGVAYYRPGPISGTIVGGVAVVYDDSAAVRSPNGGVADLGVIAANANPDLAPTITEVAGRTVLGWPDSEVVSAGGLSVPDRSVSRYVVVLDEGIAMVTFDDVDPELANDYLATVAGAL